MRPANVRRQCQRKWTSWVALAAAYLMAVQTLLVSLNLGAIAAHLNGDMSGHVLCLGGVPGRSGLAFAGVVALNCAPKGTKAHGRLQTQAYP
jgi:hypothetical protein